MSVLIGCSGSPDSSSQGLPVQSAAAEFDPSEVQRDSIISLIEGLDTEGFLSSYQSLSTYDYTRYTRTEQFNDDEYMVAFTERTVRHAGEAGNRTYEVLSADSTGTYDFGYFRTFVSSNVEEQDPEDLTPYVFPDDPIYLSQRNFEAYFYRFNADSLMTNLTAQVVEVRARPEEGDGKNIRKARYFIDPATRKLLAFELERIDLALFFREESRFFVHIQQTPDQQYIPYNTLFETRIIVPFRPPQRFRTVSTYSDITVR